jgi:hypothetical protein
MELDKLIDAIHNDRIEFATMRPPGSRFALLERRVIIIAPSEAITLAHSGDIAALPALVDLLTDPDRAWAAVVVLAAMTGREAKMVDTYAGNPAGWWTTLGETAHDRWSTWLNEIQDDLVWDDENKIFTV